jgi:hypothetical protein
MKKLLIAAALMALAAPAYATCDDPTLRRVMRSGDQADARAYAAADQSRRGYDHFRAYIAERKAGETSHALAGCLQP